MHSAPCLNSTILDVAREARVSKTSVSRYFGHERERLSPELQTRIAMAAQRLGYRPNRMARGLKGGSSGLVGMLVADIRNPFSVAVMHGIEQACRERSLSLMVCNTDNDPSQERAHLELLASYRVEGLIINAAGSPDRELQALAERGIPLVLLDRDVGSVDADVVGLDNHMAIDMALDHLQAQGYRTLLYISEPPAEASSRRARLNHFQRGCRARALNGRVHDQMLGEGDTLHRAISDFLSRRADSPSALLCANGRVTLAVTRVLQELGVPLGETGLLGIDELDWCALVPPGITTLAQPTEAIGRAALECLLAEPTSSGASLAPPYLHPPVLMARGSTRR
ncbi:MULTISPECIES: LacI family DNA-binding transcriptional regulator [unclassified Halomonas]|uniref:LacI family DNA-binding transcriptional regulator n=1 Tax=unclassified Halomonas TaxID=2609666 RepID=UPI002888CCCE|nr:MULTISPECIES: LacI family DNA-binding transcriptional regulator [unclassified Halomonas]MDT0499913.1 LacI family DNA-binding transcriptional regulator [Halomonas sp. PAR7]MDT0512318.1 LacI family DNA-binding transcriptional regulator [Halomonas sp. LES1]MDT0590951.1 LacI family DNA-binding transcriptional regulator [Halomonas sp. PAR8]